MLEQFSRSKQFTKKSQKQNRRICMMTTGRRNGNRATRVREALGVEIHGEEDHDAEVEDGGEERQGDEAVGRWGREPLGTVGLSVDAVGSRFVTLQSRHNNNGLFQEIVGLVVVDGIVWSR